MSREQLTKYLNRLFDAIDNGISISELIADDEIRSGRRLVRPGEADWLPLADWRPETVCSLSGRRAHLVLLHARVEGRGAFTRLVRELERNKLIPFVICPTREFQMSLARNGWKKTRLCGEEAWRLSP